MDFNNLLSPSTLLKNQLKNSNKKIPQDDKNKVSSVMNLKTTKNNYMVKNYFNLSDQNNPKARLESQISQSSSSSNLREEQHTTADGMSKPISFRSLSRGGIASERNKNRTSQIKTVTEGNETAYIEKKETFPFSNYTNQTMRGVKSEKNLVTMSKVNTLIGNFGKEKKDKQILITIPVLLENSNTNEKEWDQQQISKINYFSPAPPSGSLGFKNKSQFPSRTQQQTSSSVSKQLVLLQSTRSPAGNLLSDPTKHSQSYHNDSTLTSNSIVQNSFFPPNSPAAGEDRQDTTGDDEFYNTQSSFNYKHKTNSFFTSTQSTNRFNAKTAFPNHRGSLKLGVNNFTFLSPKAIAERQIGDFMKGGGRSLADSPRRLPQWNIVKAEEQMQQQLHYQFINSINEASKKDAISNKDKNTENYQRQQKEYMQNEGVRNKYSRIDNLHSSKQNRQINQKINLHSHTQQVQSNQNTHMKSKTEPETEDDEMEQQKSTQQKQQINVSKFSDNSILSQDTFNIFGQAHDFAHSLQLKLKQNLIRLQPSKDIIQFADLESKNIQHKITTMNAEKNMEMFRNSFRASAEGTISTISKIFPFFEEGMNVIEDRNALDEVLTKIYTEACKGKNIVVQILCAKAFGKILKLNKNYSKSIELYKSCKNVADKPIFFSYRMNCYKNIGFCFAQLKMYDFAMFYYGKMLRVAWYLGDKDFELQAYDLIGMQYYYQGKLDKAFYYHNKMIKGDVEGEQSDLRRLGISKIDNELKMRNDGNGYGNASGDGGLIAAPRNIQRAKQARARQQNADNLDKSQDFYISSESEDDFELPFPTQSHQQQYQEDYENNNNHLDKSSSYKESITNDTQDPLFSDEEAKKNEKLGIGIRKRKKNEPLFYHKDLQQIKQIADKANQNIRIGALEKKKELQIVLPPQKQITASSFKQIKGSTKTPYRLNHLSVNRELENYQCFDARVTKIKRFNFNDQMYDQYDSIVKTKIKNIFEDLRDNLLFAMANLEMMVQKSKYPSKRKVGICLMPTSPPEKNQYNQKIVFSTLYQDFSKR